MPTHVHHGSPSHGRPARSTHRALRDGHDRQCPGQQVETVVRRPHARADRHQRVHERHEVAAQRRSRWRRPTTRRRHPAAPPARCRGRARRGLPAPAPRPWSRAAHGEPAFERRRPAPIIAKALSSAPNTNTTTRAATSHRCARRPMPERRRASASSSAGHAGRERDVVVRTRLHAVEAQRAIEVADLGRQEEAQLAAAPDHAERLVGRAPSLDAIHRPARLRTSPAGGPAARAATASRPRS